MTPGVLATVIGLSLCGSPEEGAASIQDLVVLGETRPVLLRLRVRIGDRPFRDAWVAGVATLHRGLDSDGDGKVTTEEATKGGLDPLIAPPVAPRNTGARSRPEPDANKDGVISIEELSESLRATSGPFRLRVEGPGDRRTDVLFDHLDRDKDGELNRAELETLAGSLRKLDRDADETIDAAEVALLADSPVAASRTAMRGGAPHDPGLPAVVELALDESPVRLARMLIKRYDTGSARGPGRKDGKLSPEESGLPEPAFRAADRNGDDLLSPEELRVHLAKAPRDAILDVTLSADASGTATAELRGGAGGASSDMTVRRPAPGVIEGDLGPLRLDVHVDDGAEAAVSMRKSLQDLLKRSDADANGYLQAEELTDPNGATSPLSGIFPALDGDGDGKVYPKDLDEFVARQAAAARSRLTVTVANEGRSAFGLLDLDRDRRLGAREVLEAVSRVSACDRDRDGRIAPEEVPHHIQIELSRGDLSALLAVPSANGAVGVNAPLIASPRAPRSASGPSWFQKTDRNHDGDVSPREFLGGRSQFDRIDTDGDGLIAPAEAEAATRARGPGT